MGIVLHTTCMDAVPLRWQVNRMSRPTIRRKETNNHAPPLPPRGHRLDSENLAASSQLNLAGQTGQVHVTGG